MVRRFTIHLFCSVLFVFATRPTHAEAAAESGSTLQAELYELKAASSTPKFHFLRRDNVQSGVLSRESTFRDSEDHIVATEKIVYAGPHAGTALTDYQLANQQSHINIRVQRIEPPAEKNKKTLPTYEVVVKKADGSQTSESFPIRENLILPPQLLDQLTAHLIDWEQKQDWEFNLLVPDLQMTVTMKVSVAETTTETLRLKLRPAYWAIAAFVSPLYFNLDRKTKLVTRAEGQTLLLGADGKPFVARTEFRLPSPKP